MLASHRLTFINCVSITPAQAAGIYNKKKLWLKLCQAMLAWKKILCLLQALMIAVLTRHAKSVEPGSRTLLEKNLDIF